MKNPSRPLKVAVIGATGLVGRELLRLFETRRFPVRELLAFNSGTSGARARFRGRLLSPNAPSFSRLRSADVAFFASSPEVALRFGPSLAREKVWVIDDSSAFRLDPRVPLVIPEVNAASLSRRSFLIAGPNCTLTGAAVAACRIIREAGLRAIRIASYQSVSGAGKAALEEFLLQNSELPRQLRGDILSRFLPVPRRRARALPRPIAMNVFPQVGSFDLDGRSEEENKVADELRKIWSLPSLPVSATAVRVPVWRGHSLSVWLSTRRPMTPARARTLLRRTPGVRLWAHNDYPTPQDAQGTDPVHVGRVRTGIDSRELCLWTVSDNLLKGAALNSIQIAEELLRRGWLRSTRRKS